MAKIDHTGAWKDLYEFLRQQEPGTEISWRRLTEVARHDVRSSRMALTRAKQEMALVDGLTLGNQSPYGVEVMSTRQEVA